MITDRLQHIIDKLAKLPPEEQDRVAAAMQMILGQPAPQLSPEWRAAAERAMREQAETLEYLKDK